MCVSGNFCISEACNCPQARRQSLRITSFAYSYVHFAVARTMNENSRGNLLKFPSRPEADGQLSRLHALDFLRHSLRDGWSSHQHLRGRLLFAVAHRMCEESAEESCSRLSALCAQHWQEQPSEQHGLPLAGLQLPTGCSTSAEDHALDPLRIAHRNRRNRHQNSRGCILQIRRGPEAE